MDERIDIVNKDGYLTRQSELKSVIHKKGFYHNTAHVWFYTNSNEILLAQRAKSKTIHPLLWDVSVAGHVDAGESVIKAAIRETQEEIGLKISEDNLIKIGIFPCFKTYDNGIIDNEFHHTFISELRTDLERLKPQENEVQALKMVTFQEFEDLLESSEEHNHFIKTNSLYYLFVLNTIKGKLEQH